MSEPNIIVTDYQQRLEDGEFNDAVVVFAVHRPPDETAARPPGCIELLHEECIRAQ